MSDTLDLVARPLPPLRTQQQHHEDIKREYVKHKMDQIDGISADMQGYFRELIRTKADVTEELDELETMAHGLLLVALILKREASKG